jgi:general secretion pathway protein D
MSGVRLSLTLAGGLILCFTGAGCVQSSGAGWRVTLTPFSLDFAASNPPSSNDGQALERVGSPAKTDRLVPIAANSAPGDSSLEDGSSLRQTAFRAAESGSRPDATSFQPAAALPLGKSSSVAVAPPLLPAPRPLEKPISLHFDDVEIRKALELLSREGKLNILVSPGVVGSVTAHLKDVTPDQALTAIARLSSLVIRREENLVYVYTPEEIARGLGPDQWIATHIYHLNYVRSTDVAQMIRPFLSNRGLLTSTPSSAQGLGGNVSGGGGTPPPTPGGGGAAGVPGGAGAAAGGPNAGAGGGVGASTGGNLLAGGEMIVVQDQISVLREVDKVIAQLDVPPLQVEIEAVIMSVEHDKDQELSVNFAIVDQAFRTLGTFGSGALINAAAGFSPARTVNPDGSLRPGSAANDQAAKLAHTGNNLTYFIRALETTGKVEVLARPKILVLNKQQAFILLGQQLGYSTLSQNLVSTTQQVQFLNVGTQLRVRPFISSDGMIRMEVHPERSTGVLDAQNIPQITTSEVTTNVMVPDGATLVIGGLVDQVDSRNQLGTPFLSDLPLVGTLFRQRIRNGSRRELVVLMTTRIWNPTGPPAAPYLSPPAFMPADAGKIFPVSPNLPDLDTLARPLAAPVRVTPPIQLPPANGAHSLGQVAPGDGVIRIRQ